MTLEHYKTASVVHTCNHPKLNKSEAMDSVDGLTDSGMDAGWQAICTGPNFGCVHHELK